MLDFRIRMQIAEALGPVNRWYCSMYYDRMIDDPELLMRYFIKSGGARSFALRYGEAMSPLNRWFCSEHHRCDVSEPEKLWHYYMNCVGAGIDSKPSDLRNRVSA